MVTINENHEYFRDGKAIPLCVTHVLTLAGICGYPEQVPRFYIARARDIGRAVHKATLLLDADDLEGEEELDPLIRGHVQSYRRFLDRHLPSWEAQEECVADGIRVAGTLDRRGWLFAPPAAAAKRKERKDAGTWERCRAIIDIKTAKQPEAWWGLQLTGYAVLAELEDHRLFSVHIQDDGRFTETHLREYPLQKDPWLAAVEVAEWRTKHGAKVRDPLAERK